MAAASWAKAYVGLPYRAHGRDMAGVDCWGLVRLVMAREFGVDLPDMAAAYPDPDDRAALHAMIRAKLQDREEFAACDVQAGDVLFFKQEGHVSHCGVAIGPDLMLHARDGRDVVVDSFTVGVWARRLHAVHRVRVTA